MAWLQRDPSQNYHISFRIGGRRFKRSLRTKDEDEALARNMRLEVSIRLVESGRLDPLDGVDLPTYLLSDGKRSHKSVVNGRLTLSVLFDDFFENLPDGNLESSTLRCMHIHKRHLIRHLGARFAVDTLGLSHLQRYVTLRSQQKGLNDRKVGANTMKKEVATFGCVWNWRAPTGLLKRDFPRKGLRFPKEVEKPPFQTWDQIERQIAKGALTEAEEKELWNCLFLRRPSAK